MGYLGTYRGDYLGSYRGDPGFFGFLGKAIKTVAGVAGRVLGGPIGLATGAILGRTSAARSTRLVQQRRPPAGIPLPGPFRAQPGAILPGGRPFITAEPGTLACPAGYHPNKQDGKGGPKGTYCVRNRRMEPGNLKAGRRAARRIASAEKHLRTFIRVKKKVKVKRRRR